MAFLEWTARATMPERKVAATYCVAPNGHIFVAGGSRALYFSTVTNTFTRTVYEYVPDEDRWVVRAPLPLPATPADATLMGAASCVIGNKLYVIGGKYVLDISGTGTWQTTLYEMDIPSNTWTTKTDVPSAVPVTHADMVSPVACARNGQIHLISWDTGFKSLVYWVWTQATDTWSYKATSGPGLAPPAGAEFINDILFVQTLGGSPGGSTATAGSASIVRVSPVGAFSRVADIPLEPNAVFDSVEINNLYGENGGLPSRGTKLYPAGVITNYDTSLSRSNLWEFDTITNTFTAIAGRDVSLGIVDIPNLAGVFGLVGAIGPYIFTIGGIIGDPFNDGSGPTDVDNGNSNRTLALDLTPLNPDVPLPPPPITDTADSWYVGRGGVWRRGTPHIGPSSGHGRTYIGRGGIWTPADRID